MKKISSFFMAIILCVTAILFSSNIAYASSAAEIESATYKISTAINGTYALDISGASTEDGANVQLWEYVDVNQEKYKICHVSGDYYKIVAVHSGKVLDVEGGSSAEQTNVQQYSWNGSDAQLWRFISAGDGYYYIQSKLGCYLDVQSGIAGNGANVWVYTGNQTTAQKWKLTKVNAAEKIEDGLYTIASAINTNYVIDVDAASTADAANIQIWLDDNVNQQKFYIKSLGGEYYTIMAAHSNKVLDVAGGFSTEQTNVQQYSSNESDAQQWRFISAGDGYYYIQSKLGCYLDVQSGTAANGTNVWVYTGNQTTAQKWKLSSTSLAENSESTYSQKVNAFINDSRWKNGTTWGSSQKGKLSLYDCSGCCAYTADFAKYVFDKNTPRGGSIFYNPSSIRSGDIIYVTGSSHWLVVLYRNGNQLTTAEGNWNSKVVISDSKYTVSGNTLMMNGTKFRTFSCGYHFQ